VTDLWFVATPLSPFSNCNINASFSPYHLRLRSHYAQANFNTAHTQLHRVTFPNMVPMLTSASRDHNLDFKSQHR